MMTQDQFLLWETTNHDIIGLKKTYVDMAGGDIIAGLVLSEIVYWHLPNKRGESKLRVERDGHFWLAAARHEWYDRVRIQPKQFDRAAKILTDRGLIAKELYKFNNSKVVHVRVLWDGFLSAFEAAARAGKTSQDNAETPQSDTTTNTDHLPKSGIPPSQIGNDHLPKSGTPCNSPYNSNDNSKAKSTSKQKATTDSNWRKHELIEAFNTVKSEIAFAPDAVTNGIKSHLEAWIAADMTVEQMTAFARYKLEQNPNYKLAYIQSDYPAWLAAQNTGQRVPQTPVEALPPVDAEERQRVLDTLAAFNVKSVLAQENGRGV